MPSGHIRKRRSGPKVPDSTSVTVYKRLQTLVEATNFSTAITGRKVGVPSVVWCTYLRACSLFVFEHDGCIKFTPVDHWLFTQLNSLLYCARICTVRMDWLSSSNENVYIQLPELHNVSKRFVFFWILTSKSPFSSFPNDQQFFFFRSFVLWYCE